MFTSGLKKGRKEHLPRATQFGFQEEREGGEGHRSSSGDVLW